MTTERLDLKDPALCRNRVFISEVCDACICDNQTRSINKACLYPDEVPPLHIYPQEPKKESPNDDD